MTHLWSINVMKPDTSYGNLQRTYYISWDKMLLQSLRRVLGVSHHLLLSG